MPRGTRTAASSTVAVGLTITDRPSHRSVRAHTALTVDTGGHRVSASVVRPPTDTAQTMDAAHLPRRAHPHPHAGGRGDGRRAAGGGTVVDGGSHRVATLDADLHDV